ncbi:dedicator of cytokinesis protein 9-like isoform X2 [Dendronephthya gigantea]|uniref:dedicator of cytokinesis protein 9-like isoform X2 n=1 Tax=Dendronephthya gigantea TaxID=151771 RepID=UPI00106C083C|nr:dedicator of cytokinesis protein 9-like isoform X2 [Dendronephthya gigantea]
MSTEYSVLRIWEMENSAVQVVNIPLDIRTEYSSVPRTAKSEAQRLFVKECIKTYTSNWQTIENKYSQYSGSYNQLYKDVDLTVLLEQKFEIDLDSEEGTNVTELYMSPRKEVGLAKHGYLNKAPFHSESDGLFSGKTFKRRWFSLKEISNDGSYVLEYRKDDNPNSTAKGSIYLDACTEITRGVRGKMHGFEIRIQDKIYSLVADTQSEMESWLSVLCKVTGIDMATGKSKSASSGGWFSGKNKVLKNTNFRESLKQSKHPELMEFARETDQVNAKRRQEGRNKIFSLSSLSPNVNETTEETKQIRLPYERFGKRFLVHCGDLKFRLSRSFDSSSSVNIEPFFITLALFDVKENKKISEDFHCDVNDTIVSQMLPSPENVSNGSNGVNEHHFSFPKKAIFSVTYPHPDVYLVLRIEKVLQGGITSCTEPYMKSGDALKKGATKAYRSAEIACQTLSKYRMPFALATRPLFKNNQGDLDEEKEWSPVYKQDSGKLSDDELLKLLEDMAGKEKFKQQIIPATIKIDVTSLPKELQNSMTSSLLPVRPFNDKIKIEPTLEVQEFVPVIPDAVHPHMVYTNNFYVYPLMLNFNNQKVYSKARNIAVTVEFKEYDSLGSSPLKCIYNRSGCVVPSFTKAANTTVLHHCTNPTFYDEIKICLPVHVHEKHHLFFKFHHVSCEQKKAASGSNASVRGKAAVESEVGYAWLPLLKDGRVAHSELSIPVATLAPDGYLNSRVGGLGKNIGPDVKWLDGGKPLLKISTKVVSTVHTQDVQIDSLFRHLQESDGTPASERETSNLLKLLFAADNSLIIEYLPTILNQLFHVLIVTKLSEVTKNTVRVLVRFVSQLHDVNRSDVLHSYVKYSFVTDQLSGFDKTVYEELTKGLLEFLKPGADSTITSSFLKHAWWFFEVILKSMGSELIQNGKLQSNRETRYSKLFYESLEHLLQLFVPQILRRLKDEANVAKEANIHMAYFVKGCFTYIDRGFVFQMISYYNEQFKDADTQMMEFRFDFLKIICQHEHYIPLNLPLDCRALGDLYDFELTDSYCKNHFLCGMLLRQVSQALVGGRHIRKMSIRILRDLLIKHELDDRYSEKERQSRIAALYLPFLTITLEHAGRFPGSHHSEKTWSSSQTMLASNDQNTDGTSGSDSYPPSISSRTTTIASLSEAASRINAQVPFDDEETKDLVLCVLYIVKNLEQTIVLDWFKQISSSNSKLNSWNTPFSTIRPQQDKLLSKFSSVIDFFDLLQLSVKHLQYRGKASSPKQATKSYLEQKYQDNIRPTRASLKSQNQAVSYVDSQIRVLMEGNFANELGLVVLDLVELFSSHFRFHMEKDEGNNVLMSKVFGVLLTFLQVGQSDIMLKHVFASLRSFIHKFPTALFKGAGDHCGRLIYEVLRCCSCKLEMVRHQAHSLLYLLMRSNYEYSGGAGCIRVHLQVLVAVSKLIALGQDSSSMSRSLIALRNYVNGDKALEFTSLNIEVKDLIKKVHTVLQATSRMKEYGDNVEMLVDLQYSLAKSYSSTPELRKTWLENMAAIHEQHNNYSEAAHCHIHAAALVAEYLKRKGSYPEGCEAFRNVSPNIVPDESVMKNDEGLVNEQRYATNNLVELLERSADLLAQAERYEVTGEIYKLVIPVYEQDRNFNALSIAYNNLSQAYSKVVAAMASRKRLLGSYFRVAFFGEEFGLDNRKQFIYKEPKVTSLSEISSRLEKLYSAKLGSGKVKLILESAKVNVEKLESGVNYIQITFVVQYFEDDELNERPTVFERNNNIRRFSFETPFTKTGKSHGSLVEQLKRKTILTTSHCFPYVKTRILVVQEEQYELTPIEVAIDEMHKKVQEITEVTISIPPDMKKLQLKLQGSVGTQVNAGPLAYAKAFLHENVVRDHPPKLVSKLKVVYRDFIRCCGAALDLNDQLIQADQKMYQEDLKDKYSSMRHELASYIDLNLASSSCSLSSIGSSKA